MRQLIKLVCSLLLLFSCLDKPGKENSKSNSTRVMKEVNKYDKVSLLSFTADPPMAYDSAFDAYYENRNKFIAPYKSREIRGDTLWASTLFEINACAETVARIRFSNDSLFLHIEQVGDIACTTFGFRKYNYVIVKKDIGKYVIVY